jgi:hypothetical protein
MSICLLKNWSRKAQTSDVVLLPTAVMDNNML